MSWFHYTKHERLQRRRQLRMEAAERAIKETSTNWYMVPGIIEPCIGDAVEEAHVFEEYFGEPMPAHLRHALQVEVELWQRLILAIKNTKNITRRSTSSTAIACAPSSQRWSTSSRQSRR